MDSPHDTAPQAPRSGEWQELRGHAQHQTIEVLRLILILVQDSVILVVGWAGRGLEPQREGTLLPKRK